MAYKVLLVCIHLNHRYCCIQVDGISCQLTLLKDSIRYFDKNRIKYCFNENGKVSSSSKIVYVLSINNRHHLFKN